MGAFSSILIGSLVAAQLGTTAYTAIQQKKAAEKAEATMKDRKEDADRLENEARVRADNEEALRKATDARNQMRSRQRSRAGASQGRAGTLLTGPSPSYGGAAPLMGAGKTLLGQ